MPRSIVSSSTSPDRQFADPMKGRTSTRTFLYVFSPPRDKGGMTLLESSFFSGNDVGKVFAATGRPDSSADQ
jgi:hypothetical protein